MPSQDRSAISSLAVRTVALRPGFGHSRMSQCGQERRFLVDSELTEDRTFVEMRIAGEDRWCMNSSCETGDAPSERRICARVSPP